MEVCVDVYMSSVTDTSYILEGYQQTFNQSFDYVGESHLDLQYGMGLVTSKLNVTLYQVGDTVNPSIIAVYFPVQEFAKSISRHIVQQFP